jgi:outer membrane protein OmpA-like peptidoglycan-associated protein
MKSTLPASRLLIGAAVAAVLLGACSTEPTHPAGSAALRARLIALQSDPQLAGRAPLAMEQASQAVTAAEQPQADPLVNAHLQFMADRKISIATAEAHSRWSVDQRVQITEQRSAMQLQMRTQEADDANLRTTAAEANAADQKQRASIALDAAASAQRDTADMQRQVDELQARVTDRGLVLTLGDVLFTSGTSDLRIGGDSHLTKLAAFLNRYPRRNALIEGYTDSVGAEGYNQGLSQRRADSVKAYLVAQGVQTARLTATGMGEGSPVGDNNSATGRQQNRRVEVIIADELVSAR